MGGATPLIQSVATPAYMRVSIEASDGRQYEADLSSFALVHCFPRNLEEWRKVSIDSYGLGLIWASRFEVHVDQIVGLATRVEPVRKNAGSPGIVTHP